jgi:hypothetical protein
MRSRRGQLVLAHGARVNDKYVAGQPPLASARRHNNATIVAMLTKAVTRE